LVKQDKATPSPRPTWSAREASGNRERSAEDEVEHTRKDEILILSIRGCFSGRERSGWRICTCVEPRLCHFRRLTDRPTRGNATFWANCLFSLDFGRNLPGDDFCPRAPDPGASSTLTSVPAPCATGRLRLCRWRVHHPRKRLTVGTERKGMHRVPVSAQHRLLLPAGWVPQADEPVVAGACQQRRVGGESLSGLRMTGIRSFSSSASPSPSGGRLGHRQAGRPFPET
jgi:hypothetical protein